MKPNTQEEQSKASSIIILFFFFFKLSRLCCWRAGEDKGVLHRAAILLNSPLTPQLVKSVQVEEWNPPRVFRVQSKTTPPQREWMLVLKRVRVS